MTAPCRSQSGLIRLGDVCPNTRSGKMCSSPHAETVAIGLQLAFNVHTSGHTFQPGLSQPIAWRLPRLVSAW